jgi:excisionase family DNA binding protein
MGMDRIAARLEPGQPPVRQGDLADMLGCSTRWLRKLLDAGTIKPAMIGEERRIPVQEAAKLARDAGLIRE